MRRTLSFSLAILIIVLSASVSRANELVGLWATARWTSAARSRRCYVRNALCTEIRSVRDSAAAGPPRTRTPR
jgi:hypothetical protein